MANSDEKNRKGFLISHRVSRPPPLLASLMASQYIHAPDRAAFSSHPSSMTSAPLSYSSALLSSPLESLRYGLLLVEAALPVGALDESDERWGALTIPTDGEEGWVGLEMWASSDPTAFEVEAPFSSLGGRLSLQVPTPLPSCSVFCSSRHRSDLAGFVPSVLVFSHPSLPAPTH